MESPGSSAGARSTEVVLGRAALVAAVALVAVLASLPLAHDDLFQHLVTGQRIATTGRVPTTDFLSHTRTGAPWVSHEWGFALLAHGVHRLGGLPALLALKVALALALAAAVVAAARRLAGGAAAAGAPLAGLLATLAAWAVSRELILRAALLGAVLLAVTAWALLTFRERPRWRTATALVALFLLWANVHSGVIFGLFLVGLFALEALWRGWRGDQGERRAAAAWAGLAAACAAVVPLNPNGLAVPLYPFRLARLLGDPASGFTRGHFAGGWPGPEKLLGVLLVAALAGWLTLSRSGRRRDLLPLPWVAAGGVFALLSWRSSRLAVELLVLLVPAAYALWARWAAGREGGWGRLGALAPPAAGLVLSLVLAGGVLAARPPGVVSAHFPSGAADFLAANPPPGNMFNHQNWGGYLRWRLGEPVFWDGRNLVFAPLVREVARVPFRKVAERYGVGYLVLSPREGAQLAPELTSGRWRLAHADPGAAVYVRRTEAP